jgi:hypothetical protein
LEITFGLATRGSGNVERGSCKVDNPYLEWQRLRRIEKALERAKPMAVLLTGKDCEGHWWFPDSDSANAFVQVVNEAFVEVRGAFQTGGKDQ